MDDRNEEDFVVEEEVETGDEAVKRLREKLKKCVAEKQEYLDGWQRLKADYANDKRDAAKKISEARDFAFREAAEKLLPLVDAFDLAFAAPAWKDTDASWKTGIERLRGEVLRALKEMDVEPFVPIGEPFNPATMAASREIEGEAHIVMTVDRAGYRHKDTVIRPAYVAIGTGS
jgi:molecular chaperone GrpE